MKKSLLIIGIVLLFLAIILSCDLTESKTSLSAESETSLNELTSEIVTLDDLSLFMQEINSQKFLDIEAKKLLKLNGIDFEENIIAFSTFFINNSKVISSNNVLGFGVFYKKDKQLREKFLLKEANNSFVEKFDMLNKELSMNDIKYKFKNYIKDYNSVDIGFKLVINKEIDFSDFDSQRSEFKLHRNFNVYKRFSPNNFLPKNDSAKVEAAIFCNSWCSSSSFGSCGFYSGSCSGGCLEGSAQISSIQQEFSETEINNAFVENDDIRHDFRDTFLINRQLGQKYIAYYYGLSDFIISSDFDFTLITKIIQQSPSVDNSISKIMNSGNLSEIVIDVNLKNEIFEVLDLMKSKSDNIDFKGVLDDLKADIQYFSDKPKEVVLNEMF